MRICVVYNTCGISGRDNSNYYIHAIRSILAQDHEDKFVVVSACKVSPSIINKLKNEFGDRVAINVIDTVVPVNVSFNHTCKDVAAKDKECHFLYMDSGCGFQTVDALSKMVERLETGRFGMVSTGVTTDAGIAINDEFCQRTGLFQGRKLVLDNVVSVGCSLNLHTQIFHRELFDYYGGLMPDVFAGYCTESTFTFMCAALKKQWLYMPEIMVSHAVSIDGQSSCDHPAAYNQRTGRLNYDHPFMIDTFLDRLMSDEARRVGMGYEECQKLVLHDDSQYDENEHCVNDELAPWIKDNIFLKEHEFSYDSIESDLI